jgi:hypothetical protein
MLSEGDRSAICGPYKKSIAVGNANVRPERVTFAFGGQRSI